MVSPPAHLNIIMAAELTCCGTKERRDGPVRLFLNYILRSDLAGTNFTYLTRNKKLIMIGSSVSTALNAQ